ncbi:unnamed protein product [Candidula unifasciata]|uniref:ZZ-type zinc finger-containing protein 3 n=1 Tax=Candidula unifasciata TaxID=100452 RepID=A0A8S3Z8A7_9EUPU|nr:unnamed protein product [Candidula unifasciata]
METHGLGYEEISEPYYFETDHVALKENQDYRNLLHTIAVLEAQRQQAAEDIELLYKAQDEALADPLKFVGKLQQGTDFCFPKAQKLASLPDVQWDKYTSGALFSSFVTSRHMTRNKRSTTGAEGCDPLTCASTADSAVSSDLDVLVVRGRARDNSKPSTFNQLWTDEEQQRLESLLIQFPPEEVESKRWAKIAAALGNRTPVQVASRVQKYFLKLAREGLPVPGRTPNLAAYVRKGSHRHHRYNRLYYPHSTFLQSHTPPVWMKDDVDECELQQGPDSCAGDILAMSDTASLQEGSSEDEQYPEEIRSCPEYKELQQLLKIKRDKQPQEHPSLVQHIGYKCDNCCCEPIIGTRWHCIDCPAEMSLDFCGDCCHMSCQGDRHDPSHRLHPFRHAGLDSDYMGYFKANYNYLDPNYLPAS